MGQRLTDQLVAEGRPRDVTEIAVEAWLASVRAACVKWIQAHDETQANRCQRDEDRCNVRDGRQDQPGRAEHLANLKL